MSPMLRKTCPCPCQVRFWPGVRSALKSGLPSTLTSNHEPCEPATCITMACTTTGAAGVVPVGVGGGGAFGSGVNVGLGVRNGSGVGDGPAVGGGLVGVGGKG